MLGKNQQESTPMVTRGFCADISTLGGLRIPRVRKDTFSSLILGLKNGAEKGLKNSSRRELKGLGMWFTERYVNITGLYPESVFVVIQYFVEANVVEEEKRPNC